MRKVFPAVDSERILTVQFEARACLMQFRHCTSECGAVRDVRPPNPHTLQKGDDHRRAPHEFAERAAFAILHWLWASDSARGKVLHQADEKRQVVRCNALFIEGQDEIAALSMQQKICVLDA